MLPCRCTNKCLDSISTEDQQKILADFLNMTAKNEQDVHLQRMIEFEAVKRKRPGILVPEKRRKPKSQLPQYKVLHGAVRKAVCKKAFLSVHGVTKKRVERIVELLKAGKNPVDMRGKNTSGNKISEETREYIHNHISSFPTHLSHYTGTPTKYLDPNLSIMTMFELFKKQYPDDKVSYGFYWNYFRLKFSLRFGRPAKDCCGQCEALCIKIKNSSLSENDRKLAVAEWVVHKLRSQQFYKAMQTAKETCLRNRKVAALSLDFMANVSLPCIPVQDLYYLRQLTANTFGIHDLRTEKMVCYAYSEFDGHKGPNEVCTFLFDYFKKYVEDGVTTLLLFADNCGGQNKNHTLLRFVMALVELNWFEEVTINFPIRGHSYMPCDRDFGLIKRKMKPKERIYTLEQYESIIKSSSKVPDKFRLEKVEAKNIIDFKGWWGDFYKKQCVSKKSSVPKEKFLISKYCYFNVNKTACGEVTCKTFINGTAEQKFVLRKNPKSQMLLPDKKAYKNKLPILSSKMEDIKKIMQYIPEEHHEFWNEVLKLPTRSESTKGAEND